MCTNCILPNEVELLNVPDLPRDYVLRSDLNLEDDLIEIPKQLIKLPDSIGKFILIGFYRLALDYYVSNNHREPDELTLHEFGFSQTGIVPMAICSDPTFDWNGATLRCCCTDSEISLGVFVSLRPKKQKNIQAEKEIVSFK